MTTATTIINESLSLLGVKAPGQPVASEDADLCLTRLNVMLDAWSAESLYAYATQTISGSLTAGAESLSIGPSQTLNIATRPIRIEEGSYFTSGGIDYPIIPVTGDEYRSVGYKAQQSLGPTYAYLNPTFPNGTIYFYPVPSAAVTVNIVCLTYLTAFADLTTDYSLPPGYQQALVYSLAEEVAAFYEREPSPTTVRKGMLARRSIKRANVEVPQLDVKVLPDVENARPQFIPPIPP